MFIKKKVSAEDLIGSGPEGSSDNWTNIIMIIELFRQEAATWKGIGRLWDDALFASLYTALKIDCSLVFFKEVKNKKWERDFLDEKEEVPERRRLVGYLVTYMSYV